MRSTLAMNQKTADKIRGLPACPDSVLYNPGVSILITDLEMGFKRWVPPKSGKFVELGLEDEHWARPLGIGTLEDVDFFAFKIGDDYLRKFNEKLDAEIMGGMGVPESIIYDTTTYSGSLAAMGTLMKRMRY